MSADDVLFREPTPTKRTPSISFMRSANLASGSAVFFDIEADTARVGVAFEELGLWAVMPMGPRLERGTKIFIDPSRVIPLRDLQQPLSTQTKRDNIGTSILIHAGTLVLQRLPDDATRYRMFEVIDDIARIPGTTEPDVAKIRSIRLDQDAPDNCESVEDKTADLRDLLTLRSLISEAQLQYSHPPDRFWYIYSTPLITNWTISESANITFPSKHMEGEAVATLVDGELFFTIEAPESPLYSDEPRPVSSQIVYEKLIDGSMMPSDESNPAWRIDDIRMVGASHESSKDKSIFRFRATSLSLLYGDSAIVATRETFRGLEIKAFSHTLVSESANIFELIRRNAFIFSLFGRDSRITQSISGYVTLIYEGSPFTSDQMEDIQAVLQYLCGKRGQHFSTETFDVKERVSFQFRDRGGPSSQGLPPIKLTPWSGDNIKHLAQLFPTMVDAAQKLRARSPNGIPAAFHHYFEGVDSGYPVSRTLMLAVAIDSLIAAHVGNQKQALLFEKSTFKKIVKPLRKTAKVALEAAKIDPKQIDRFIEKLDTLNNASASRRQNVFWERLGIILAADEVEVLKSRHNVVHEGHLGDERSPSAIWEAYRRSNVLATLFNRAMLLLLGWTGRCLDHTDYSQETEITLREAFRHRDLDQIEASFADG